jgi:hypothetical protein
MPQKNKEDMSLGEWVGKERHFHNKNKMQPDRKELLDKIEFSGKHCALAARASTPDVRGLVIRSFHALRRSCFSLSFFFRLFV